MEEKERFVNLMENGHFTVSELCEEDDDEFIRRIDRQQDRMAASGGRVRSAIEIAAPYCVPFLMDRQQRCEVFSIDILRRSP